MCIAIGGKHFKHAVSQFKDTYVVRTSTKVKDHYFLVLALFIQPVGKGGRGRLVYDTLYFQSCDLSSFFCSLALTVIKVCGNCDHCATNVLAQVILSGFLHFLKDHRTELLWSVHPPVNIDSGGVVVTFYDFIS